MSSGVRFKVLILVFAAQSPAQFVRSIGFAFGILAIRSFEQSTKSVSGFQRSCEKEELLEKASRRASADIQILRQQLCRGQNRREWAI